MKKNRLDIAGIVFYSVLITLFLGLYFYMNMHEDVSVRSTRAVSGSYTVEQYAREELSDPEAPIGVRYAYRWTLPETGLTDETLVFYLVHHYADVYIDDSLVYSIGPKKTNWVSKTIGCVWVTVDLHPEDRGKEVRVVVTPVYDSVRDREPDFQIGSLYHVYMGQLEKDLSQFFLSGICCVMGLLISLMQAILILRKKAQNWSIFFIGNFTFFLGASRLTDTGFSSILFDQHVLLIYYISVGAIYLACISAALFFHQHLGKSRTKLMLWVAILACLAALAAFALQILNIADLKETLPLAHGMIVLVVIALFITMCIKRRRDKRESRSREWAMLSFLSAGVLTDLLLFYILNASDHLIFSILAILLYSVLLFINNLLDANKRAYTDASTGLFNRTRWESLINNPGFSEKNVGIIMFDLNRLKHTNDTMGHDAGDRMIFTFANVLRNAVPLSDTICRWGGDEFIVVSMDATPGLMRQYLWRIHAAVEAYNESGQQPELHFAAGYALASEFPGLSPSELLRKADERMYLDKHQWYTDHNLQHS